MTETRYSFSLKTLSPSARLVQIEKAQEAIVAGSPSVAITTQNEVIVATEKKQTDDVQKLQKFYNDKTCVLYSGVSADYKNLLTEIARDALPKNLSFPHLVQKISGVMQEYTDKEDKHPYRVSLLVCGWEKRPFLFQCDPSGAYFAWKATALGKNHDKRKSFLEQRFNENLTRVEACNIALLTLEESFEGDMTENNVELGIVDENKFEHLSTEEVKSLLDKIRGTSMT